MSAPLDKDALKARMKAAWMAGDQGLFAKYYEPGALELFASWKVAPGTRMLDVACGAGQIAIPAARSGINVVGIDIATNLIEQARARAAAEGLVVQFDEGDAEQLPYPDASFDTVVSMLGAMFAPHPDRVATELVRVCRLGGRIIMVNWTPTGVMGQMLKLYAKFIPPRPGIPPYTLWGDEDTVRERLRDGVSELHTTRRVYPLLKYPFSLPEVAEFYRQYNGPTNFLFAALDAEKQAVFRREWEQLFAAYNRATDRTTLLEAECLEVIAIRG
jgi:SAM-dependent methyltransferase